MRYLAALSLLIALAPAAGGEGSFYRCTSAAGEVLFTDRPCPNAADVRRLSAPRAQQAGSLALDPATRETLDAITRSNDERRSERARRQAAAQRAAARRDAERSKRCAAIDARLRSIRILRRRGYRARDARALDDEVRKLRAEARAAC